MVVDLEQISFATISGTRVELHFIDGGLHMRRFDSVDEMVAAMREWREKAFILNPHPKSVAK